MPSLPRSCHRGSGRLTLMIRHFHADSQRRESQSCFPASTKSNHKNKRQMWVNTVAANKGSDKVCGQNIYIKSHWRLLHNRVSCSDNASGQCGTANTRLVKWLQRMALNNSCPLFRQTEGCIWLKIPFIPGSKLYKKKKRLQWDRKQKTKQ